MSHTSTLFLNILTHLGLTEAYEKEASRLTSLDYLEDTINRTGFTSFVDDGSVLDSSFSNPMKFMDVTDALVDHLNKNLDTLPEASTILSRLLDVEQVAACRFVPRFNMDVSGVPGHVDVSVSEIGLTLQLIGSKLNETLGADTEFDEVLDDEDPTYEYVPLGMLTVYESGTLHWEPEQTTQQQETVSEEVGADAETYEEPEIPATPTVRMEDVTADETSGYTL